MPREFGREHFTHRVCQYVMLSIVLGIGGRGQVQLEHSRTPHEQITNMYFICGASAVLAGCVSNVFELQVQLSELQVQLFGVSHAN